MSKDQISQRTIQYEAYRNGSQYLGTTTVDMPEIALLAEDVTGGGINGTVNTPTMAQFDALSTTLNFRTHEESYYDLFAQEIHAIDLRAAIQIQNRLTGQLDVVPYKFSFRGVPKNMGLGSLEPGATSDNSVEFEVTYIKITLNGVVKMELDKYNSVCVINGVDYYAKIRQALGN
ncbi:phage major tail tube protein [Paenibacillus terrae]|uniref:Phage tail protein n=1 Tax=Paenibacillus terrae TaxID=159743 RepID=A0A0D7X7K2_9BACL|nr:phage major tail tube protein [Paenibacillus terrae]KJD45982.1 hypothetical protein QD47_08320 [Paenibacillus terrae]